MIANFTPATDRALFGVAAVACGLVIAPLAVAAARRAFDGRNVLFARWGFSHVVWIFLLGFASGGLCAWLLRAAKLDLAPAMIDRIAALVGTLIPSIAVLELADRRDPKGIACLGLWPDRHIRAMLLGVAAYVAAIPVLFGAGLVWPWLIETFGGHYEPQKAAVELLALAGRDFWIAVVLVALVQPLFEELLFRSFLQPLLVQNLGDRGGVFLASAIFAALHGLDAFLPIFALSTLLGMLMLRTQRLSAVWLVHSLHNALVIALLTQVPASRELLGQKGSEAILAMIGFTR